MVTVRQPLDRAEPPRTATIILLLTAYMSLAMKQTRPFVLLNQSLNAGETKTVIVPDPTL